MLAYCYTQPGCRACTQAAALLVEKGYAVRLLSVMEDPLRELGIRALFKDRQVHTPVVVLPGRGCYILSQQDPPRLVRIVSLEKEVEA